ncbi:MAG: ABC transporter permease [Deltaproteobacteria bacterium]|nr:ABC transporter permease [Deltaproteobacteria bacterium]
MKETFYKPNQRYELGLFQTIAVILKNISSSRDLIVQLFKRDYFAIYKKSYLGLSWVVISPLMGIVSWVFLQKTGLLVPGDVGIPYPAYLLMGTTMWGLFMGLFEAAGTTFENASYLAMQVNVARESIFVKQILIHLANFMVAFTAIILIFIAFGIFPSPWALTLPLVCLPLFFLGASLGLIHTMVTVVAPDLKKIVTVLTGLMLYTTPIIYSNNVPSEFIQQIIKWNPLTYLVCSARDIVIYGRLYDTTGFFICAGASFLIFIILIRLFYLAEDKIVERMI